jgi:hypothetical protein
MVVAMGTLLEWTCRIVQVEVKKVPVSPFTSLDAYGRFDSFTNLYNFRNRDLSPNAGVGQLGLGRWLEQDPAGYAAGDSNLYAEEMSNPVGGLDPYGTANEQRSLRTLTQSEVYRMFYGQQAPPPQEGEPGKPQGGQGLVVQAPAARLRNRPVRE